LHRQRIVEAHRLPDLGNRLRARCLTGHHDDWVARQPQQEEEHGQDRDQNDDELQDPAEKESKHAGLVLLCTGAPGQVG
jgi:hypothetical protein